MARFEFIFKKVSNSLARGMFPWVCWYLDHTWASVLRSQAFADQFPIF
jgi:hypothetical protein